MKQDDEEYIYFQESINSLNKSWAILQALENDESNRQVRLAAYHMALVEYAKPYTVTHGINKWKRYLPFPLQSESDIELHETLVKLRHSFLAHSDIRIKDAKVHLGDIKGTPFPMIISNTDPVLPKRNIVIDLINRTLEQLYAELPQYESKYENKP